MIEENYPPGLAFKYKKTAVVFSVTNGFVDIQGSFVDFNDIDEKDLEWIGHIRDVIRRSILGENVRCCRTCKWLLMDTIEYAPFTFCTINPPPFQCVKESSICGKWEINEKEFL